MCEPPADEDAIIMANSIVNSAPVIIGVSEPAQRRKLARVVTQASRELIGDRLADELKFPHGRLKRELPLLRLRNFGDRLLRRVAPPLAAYRSRARFWNLLDVSNLGEHEHMYSLPTSVFEEDSREW